ncbi:mitogen-activated protein kinase 9-like [Vicia villosa]|uniref:mitogen-activated protein kinase 9-like n=1 Tax=Vicia villosa TaxID=3911 RepID=UPI00273BBD3D|nr:mitogen-activated protein kinase 9-like [Vicia villosa]
MAAKNDQVTDTKKRKRTNTETHKSPSKPKELADFRKKKRRRHFTLEQDLARLWEKMRHHEIAKADRSKLVTEALTKNEGEDSLDCRVLYYSLTFGLQVPLHLSNVYHRDLKPKNILANANCKLKVYDFGLARVAFNDTPTTTFWTYTLAIDIWSIGCIFAEVLTGKPLFPGKSIVHQLDLITDLLGTPPPEIIAGV